MAPVEQVDEDEQYDRSSPAQRIGDHDGRERRLGHEGRVDPGDAHAADGHEHQERRRQRMAVAAHRAREDLDKDAEEVEADDVVDADAADVDDGRIVVEEREQGICEDAGQRREHDGHNHRRKQAELRHAAAARQIARAVILTDERRDGLSEGDEQDVDVDLNRECFVYIQERNISY